MPSEKILICGAGVAGSILAFWLAKHDFHVVVIERSKAGQKLGQGIEIEEPALKVVKLMGILDELNEKKTGEAGFNLVDQKSRSWAKFEIGGLSPTGALELMRGDLTEVLYKAADRSPNVTYRFETAIKGLKQNGDKVIVELEDRNTKAVEVEEFDLVVGADGARSRTRELLMGSPEEINCYKPIGAYVAYFSIPKEDQDWHYSQACHFSNRRIIWLRPVGKESEMTSAYFIYVKENVPSLRQANIAGDRKKQKEAFAELYSGLGWETPRVLEQMMKADNFYSDELVQVKLQTWSKSRVALLGDAAWAPTPFTGQGNQLAIIGAWVLAQELSRNRSAEAFQAYEKRLRSYVESSQNIPLGGRAPHIFLPKSIFGIFVLRILAGAASWVGRLVTWLNLGSKSSDRQEDEFDLQLERHEAAKIR